MRLKPSVMKRKLIARTLFFSKSLLWSVLFYLTAMTIINWEELSIRKTRNDERSYVKKNAQKELIPVAVSSISKWFSW
jgi:hypothetical protein